MHKPGHIRDMFYDIMLCGETGQMFFDDTRQARFASMDVEDKKRWLAGQVWHCTDIMPSELCEELDIQQGSTYAQGARQIRP